MVTIFETHGFLWRDLVMRDVLWGHAFRELGGPWRSRGGHVEILWSPVGSSSVPLEYLGVPWVCLRTSLGGCGRFACPLGVPWESLGGSLGCLEVPWGILGGPLQVLEGLLGVLGCGCKYCQTVCFCCSCKYRGILGRHIGVLGWSSGVHGCPSGSMRSPQDFTQGP